MEIRSPLLNSKTTKDIIQSEAASYPELREALAAIDKVGTLYDTLRAAQQTVSPLETPEARAMRYETQYQKSVAKARDLATVAATRLDTFAANLEAKAIREAGLGEEPKSAAEIRAALRSMTPAEREKAVSAAFERKDMEVLASIYQASQVTWGGTNAPVKEMFATYVDTAAPETMRQLKAVETALQGLELATDSFMKSAKKWRDPATAQKGFQQKDEFDQADAALKAALGS